MGNTKSSLLPTQSDITDDDKILFIQTPGSNPTTSLITLKDLATALSLSVVDKNDKKYVATLSQTGTDAPVETIIKGDLVIIWSRQSAKTFIGTSAGKFTVNKTDETKR